MARAEARDRGAVGEEMVRTPGGVGARDGGSRAPPSARSTVLPRSRPRSSSAAPAGEITWSSPVGTGALWGVMRAICGVSGVLPLGIRWGPRMVQIWGRNSSMWISAMRWVRLGEVDRYPHLLRDFWTVLGSPRGVPCPCPRPSSPVSTRPRSILKVASSPGAAEGRGEPPQPRVPVHGQLEADGSVCLRSREGFERWTERLRAADPRSRTLGAPCSPSRFSAPVKCDKQGRIRVPDPILRPRGSRGPTLARSSSWAASTRSALVPGSWDAPARAREGLSAGLDGSSSSVAEGLSAAEA